MTQSPSDVSKVIYVVSEKGKPTHYHLTPELGVSVQPGFVKCLFKCKLLLRERFSGEPGECSHVQSFCFIE